MAESIYRSQINPTNLLVEPKAFMEKLQNILSSYGYRIDDTKYKYKEGKKEIDFVMVRLECLREIDNYTRFKIIVDIQFENAVKQKNGMLKTGGKIVIGSWMVLDYDNKWSGNPLLTLLKGIYERYIYFPTMKKMIGIIASEHEDIEQRIKNYLKVHEARK